MNFQPWPVERNGFFLRGKWEESSGRLAQKVHETILARVVHAIFIRRDALKFYQPLAGILKSLHRLEPQRSAIRQSAKDVECSLVFIHENTPGAKGATSEH